MWSFLIGGFTIGPMLFGDFFKDVLFVAKENDVLAELGSHFHGPMSFVIHGVTGLPFILSIGYYITPEIVGGTTGTFISNRIAYHISSSLNWGLAAALGAILLAVVLGLYWAYDKIVGIDNVKLGG